MSTFDFDLDNETGQDWNREEDNALPRCVDSFIADQQDIEKHNEQVERELEPQQELPPMDSKAESLADGLGEKLADELAEAGEEVGLWSDADLTVEALLEEMRQHDKKHGPIELTLDLMGRMERVVKNHLRANRDVLRYGAEYEDVLHNAYLLILSGRVKASGNLKYAAQTATRIAIRGSMPSHRTKPGPDGLFHVIESNRRGYQMNGVDENGKEKLLSGEYCHRETSSNKWGHHKQQAKEIYYNDCKSLIDEDLQIHFQFREEERTLEEVAELLGISSSQAGRKRKKAKDQFFSFWHRETWRVHLSNQKADEKQDELDKARQEHAKAMFHAEEAELRLLKNEYILAKRRIEKKYLDKKERQF